jgi:4-diphosphocytidyl-2-C-methyl-D-erythritol kinase
MLRVVGRRPDGYHRLQTVFRLLDRCDRLYLRVRPDGRIRRVAGPDAVAADQDLTVRAAGMLQAWSGTPLGVDIRVEKHLPLGGGLGGGSSDAATALRVLARLWDLNPDVDALARLGLALGADVPVFLRGRSAWAEGIGERLQPLDLPERWYLVVVPACHVSTAAVFAADELTRNSPHIRIADFLAGEVGNDCLPVVRARHPPVAAALEWLEAYGSARLTGTGACVFAEFAAEREARRLLRRVPSEFRAFVARGLTHSPLLAALG